MRRAGSSVLGSPRSIESGGEPLLFAIVLRALPEMRASDSRPAMLAGQPAATVFAENVVDQQVLRRGDFSFHTENLGDVGDPARPVAQPLRLNDHVDGS